MSFRQSGRRDAVPLSSLAYSLAGNDGFCRWLGLRTRHRHGLTISALREERGLVRHASQEVTCNTLYSYM